jgi:hypothetical protein
MRDDVRGAAFAVLHGALDDVERFTREHHGAGQPTDLIEIEDFLTIDDEGVATDELLPVGIEVGGERAADGLLALSLADADLDGAAGEQTQRKQCGERQMESFHGASFGEGGSDVGARVGPQGLTHQTDLFASH